MSIPLSKASFRDSVVVGTTHSSSVSAKDPHVASLVLDGPLVVIEAKPRDGKPFPPTYVPLSACRQMLGVVPVAEVKAAKK